ncbi:MAG: hypothetical protein KF850_10085 [Labilithrix sp.]|nr:hypothetical protein [Labilithrix sp.]MBX3212370.1 hypothetical protein [Labilithrix sp.]
MNANHGLRKLLVASAVTLLTTGAWAENPSAAPGKTTAADKADRPAGKAADKVEKAGDKVEKAGEHAADKAAKTAKDAKEAVDPGKTDDRAARKAKERTEQREKLAATWKGPISDPLRQELRTHAERVARLERIKVVAEKEKDTATAEKAAKLAVKEDERHAGWMAKNAPVLGATPVMGAAPVTAPAAVDGKEGAK